MKCWFCNGELIWGADFSYEDYGFDGEGIIASLNCSNCNATFEGYLDLDNEEEDK